jgi:hypothetical protein
MGGKVAEIKTTPGVWRDAGRGAPGETQVAGRGAGREESRFPPRMSRPPGVSGGERRRRGERDVRRCRPTLHRRARSRRGGGFKRRGRSTLHRWAHSRRRVWEKRGMRVVREDILPRCTKGYRLLTRRA